MSLVNYLKPLVPVSARAWLKRASANYKKRIKVKSSTELEFWDNYVESGDTNETEYYQKFMMAMGNVDDIEFFRDKVCLDIGCGPMGSLNWLTHARASIGLDPLAEQYRKFGILEHRMLYLACGAENIPLPSGSVDVIFSMNSLDHVDNFYEACNEIRRLLRPGGYFISSLNLEEPYSPTEPWTLTEEMLETHLFRGWSREYYEVRPRLASSEHFGPYQYFFEPCPEELRSQPGPKALWCRFRKSDD